MIIPPPPKGQMTHFFRETQTRGVSKRQDGISSYCDVAGSLGVYTGPLGMPWDTGGMTNDE